MRKISRNGLCPCGSRLKYKKCCLTTSDNKTSTQILQSKKERDEGVAQNVEEEVVVAAPPVWEVKMSDIVLEFAEGLLQQAKTEAITRASMAIACCAWNLSFFAETQRKENIDLVSSQLGSQNPEINEEIRNIINGLVEHKLAHYSHINRYIFDYKLSWFGKNFKLNIVSSVHDVKEINFKKLTTLEPG
jgi:hypothetical protein